MLERNLMLRNTGFLIYIHLLLSQIDIFLIEAISDVIVVTVITYLWYLPSHASHNITNHYDIIEDTV